jgi:ankyrin repeat protein
MAGPSANGRSHLGRIPATLQAVFLSSNRGNDVHKPPPEKVAFKVFFRSWIFPRKAEESKKKRTGLFGGSKKKMQSKTKNTPPYVNTSPKGVVLKKETVTISAKDTQPSVPMLSPQAYLDAMITSRGYSTRGYKSLQSAYYNKPSALQQASYDLHLIEIVRAGEADLLHNMLQTGLSPNPCNQFAESLVHLVCRRGDAKCLQVLIDNGCSLQVADDYGRTPLHDGTFARTRH